jgi:CHAT domain-containing protein/Tfp pilus assembly protein PilF
MTAAALAAEAVELVSVDPAAAKGRAQEALDAARAERDPVAASQAERALGLAFREERDLAASARHFRAAIAGAEAVGAAAVAAEARIGLMATYAIAGRWKAATGEGEKALAVLTGPARARVQAQLATVLRLQGKLDEALRLYRLALPVLRDAGDDAWLARLHNNRAVTHYHRGAFPAALADFDKASRLHRAAGHLRFASQSRQSWGIVTARMGDLPAALAAFAEADELLGPDHQPDPMALRDRAIVLLSGRLVEEAYQFLSQAVAGLEASGEAGYLAEARLLLAEAALHAEHHDEARALGEQARRALTRQRRPAWAAIANGVVVRAAWGAGERSDALLRAARRTAHALDAAGFAVQAADARLLAARMALELGRPGIARHELAVATRLRDRGPVDLRARAWYAEALRRLEDGDRRGARAALRAGILVLDRYRAALGATDLKVHAAGHGEELGALGMRLAVEDGDPVRLVAWSERCRAASLRPRPVRPPRDARLAADLAELRHLIGQIYEAALAGRPTVRLLARQTAVEERVRDRARHATGLHAGALGSSQPVEALLESLGDRALVDIVEHEGVLSAVVATSGGRRAQARLVPLASRATVQAELDNLRFAQRRLAHARGSAASIQAAADGLAHGLKRLDSLLVEPLSAGIGDRPVVVVPTAALHAVPWGALPSLAWRPVAVAPSLTVWSRAAEQAAAAAGSTGGAVALVAGPRLAHATQEVAALARRHPGAVRLTGRNAVTDAVLAALDGASLAHLATHGHFRSDNPLFSCLELADGPLTVYDLEALARPPTTLVLSACDSGVSDVRPGDELLGLAASLLAIGTSTVVASIGPVPDDATRRLMLAFHANLARGLAPAAALAGAQRRMAAGGPQDLAAAVGFLCMGFG